MSEERIEPATPAIQGADQLQAPLHVLCHARLKHIAASLRDGKTVEATTVRQLLGMFGSFRRGRWVTAAVRAALTHQGLETQPDFSSAGFDSQLRFALLRTTEEAASIAREPAIAYATTADEYAGTAIQPIADESLVIGALQSGTPLVSVMPEEDVTVAETRMLLNDYSQLPVLRGRSDLRGIVTWKSIGQARRSGAVTGPVTRFMTTDYRVVDASSPLFRALSDLLRHEFVLIRDRQRSISGIVTTTDVAGSFGEQFEPFALLGDIENQLRRLIAAHFTVDECRAVAAPSDTARTITSVADLTFGEYLRLVEATENWKRLNWALDRTEVVQALDEVRIARNDLMHFSPDPITPAMLQRLRTFAEFLRPLC